jgi:hypothetical protein
MNPPSKSADFKLKPLTMGFWALLNNQHEPEQLSSMKARIGVPPTFKRESRERSA